MVEKKIFTDKDRGILITIANAYLADENNTQEEKADVFLRVSNMLHHFGTRGYNGFNWIKWYNNGGVKQFFEDYPEQLEGMTSEPYEKQNSEKYMGKEYDRFFYY